MSFLRQLAILPVIRAPSSRLSRTRRFISTRAAPPRKYSNLFLYAGGTFLAATTLLLGTVHTEANNDLANSEIEADDETISDPATGIQFPKTLKVASKGNPPTMSLVGVGVRTVSFLRMKVYSVGFYADLNNPHLQLSDSMTVDEKIEHIIRSSACLVRIIPTRDTSFTHLRDAFVRAVGARMLVRRQSGSLSEEEVLELNSPIRRLKTLFPNTPLKKHKSLDVYLTPPTEGRSRALIFRDLGGIENNWLAVEFMLHYFEGKPPSPPLKETVTETLNTLAK